MVKNNNEKFITDIKRKYINGKLITEKEWQHLVEQARKRDTIVEKTGYLKEIQLTEQFLGADVDQFILLTQQNKVMFTALLNMEEYLLFILNGKSKSVIESTEEAAKVLENIFLKLIEFKAIQKDYMTEAL